MVRIVVAAGLLIVGLSTQARADLYACKNAYILDNYEKAHKLCSPLAEGGNAEAQFYIGDMYRMGWGVLRDRSIGLQWYKKAAKNGNGDPGCYVN